MSEWKKVKLGEVCDTQYGFTASTVQQDTGTQFLRITDIVPQLIDWNTVPYCQIQEKDREKYLLHKGDIVVARTGATVGYAKYIKEDVPAVFASYLVRLLVNSIDVDRHYVGLCVESNLFKEYIQSISNGSAQPNANAQMISSFEINLPPLSTQHRIATILSRYDSLIENYQKQIKLLEEAAQRLYKEWFVDLHFPGHENTNILDGVPEGWEKKKLCEFTGITDGTHDSPKQVEIGLPLVTGRCIVDGSIDFSQAYNISEEDVIKINKRSAVEDGDILLSNIGTIGKVCRISKSGNYAVKNMIIFKPHDAIHSCFLHRFLTDNNTQMDFLQQAAGTSQKFVSLSFIRNTLILRPSDTILNLFYNHSEKYFNYVQTLQSQLRLLTEARDRLLPKLMSGEIEI